jgi:hypothetical protein
MMPVRGCLLGTHPDMTLSKVFFKLFKVLFQHIGRPLGHAPR